MTRSLKTTDIYLAGESGDDIRWIDDIAIPMIKYIFSTNIFIYLLKNIVVNLFTENLI